MAYIERDFPIERLNDIATKEGNAKKPIYQIHKWWARRLGSVFRMLLLATFADEDVTEADLWRRFYSKNDLGGKLVLDPFMGGGTTVVEALRLGCSVIGIDLNPVAWFTTKKAIEPIDLDAFDDTFSHLQETVAPDVTKYYRTTCRKCQEEVDVMYVFWVKKVACLNCGEEVRLFPSFRVATVKGKHTVFCPQCYRIQQVQDLRPEAECEECDKAFSPSQGYAARGKYTCPACGQKNRVLDGIQREEGPPRTEMFAVEYYCPHHGRGYKRPEAEDRQLFQAARQEFERREDKLLFPRQRVPEGLKTRELLNHRYEYFHQMFNERQLLCLGTLLEEILRTPDGYLRELMVLTFSDSLNANNMFCKYNAQRQELEPLYGLHAYHPVNVPVENNVWGTKLGRGTFSKYYHKTRRAKSYSANPYERYIDQQGRSRKRQVGDSSDAPLARRVEELGAATPAMLLPQTAEDLHFLPSGSVDAVITDPPYCDNVMYAELADFFYVWLRLALKDTYAEFEPDLSPRVREIVKNTAIGKDDGFFFEGLTRVFQECHRVLDRGPLVFTFHHREASAWISVIQALLDAGFYVVSVYPVRSEARTGVHGEAGNIGYDIPFVCRKRDAPGPAVSWAALQDQIHVEARRLLDKLRDLDRSIAEVDLAVVAMGKGLELYTRHHPDVLKEGVPVTVQEAVPDISRIVEALVKDFEIRELPADLDEETRMYALYLAGRKEISFDELNKRIQVGGGDSHEIFDHRFAERERSSLRVLSPSERSDFVEGLITRGKRLCQIDQIHYLYNQFEERRSIRPHLKKLGSKDLQAVCDLVYRKTGDDTYKKLAEQMEQYLRSPDAQLELGL